jgi:hypothetical protein
MDTKTWAHFCIHPKFQYLYLLQRGESIEFALGGWGGVGGEPSISVGKFSETSCVKKLRKVLEKQS